MPDADQPGCHPQSVRAPVAVSGASRYELDIQRLTDALDAVMRHRGLTARKAAEEIGISASTITRMTQGQKPDADALVSLLAWLQADAVLFTRPRPDGEKPAPSPHGRDMNDAGRDGP